MNLTNHRNRSVILAGGGTAGHVNPLLATAHAILDQDPNVQVTVVGTAQGLEAELVPAAGFELQTINRVPFPRRPNLEAIKFIGRFRKAVKQAGTIIDQAGADTVVGFGGYVSTPVYLAAKKRGLKIVAHEGNAHPGLANRLAARFADSIVLSFQNTPLKAKRGQTLVLGLPLRAAIGEVAKVKGDYSLRIENARKYGLDGSKPILLVTGGSLGAVHINDVVARSAQQILDAGFQVLHICGKGKAAAVSQLVAGVQGNYQVLEYAAQMDQIYTFTDLVITRSGAGMVSEVAALGIPAVFVPLPVGNGEQALNARDVVEAGGAILIQDRDFDPAAIESQVLPLLDSVKLKQMAAALSSVARNDAAKELAALVLR